MNITLSKRLLAIAQCVPFGARVADVGTDHGYIPAWLIQNEVSSFAIASDINEGPLSCARKTAHESGVFERIDFRLCPGLDSYEKDEVDCIIIAGMGGEMTVKILEAAPWAKEKRLILQPQSKHEVLSAWLSENGYNVSAASLACDMGKIYIIYVVEGFKAAEKLSSTDLIIDKALVERKDPLLEAFLNFHIKKMRKKLAGLEKSSMCDDTSLNELRAQIDEFEKIKKEAQSWQQ